jgi:predicted AlkP superfamily pyrophosphatase or phosphodiesterase
MRRLFLFSPALELALVFAALFAGGVRAAEPASPRARHVFILSFDQAGPVDVQNAEMPVFKRLAAEGAHTWEAYTIVPSLTLPSHVSMLTGVGIQKHQVLWNDWDVTKPPLAVPTIFRFAKDRGLGTAMIVSKSKFNTLGLSGFLDAYVTPEDYRAAGIAAAFVELWKTRRPNLCFIHFGDPDRAGHAYGVTSPEKKQALADCDAALRTVVDAVSAAGLADSSVFILTADHGGHDVVNQEGRTVGTHGTAHADDVTIPWIAWGRGVKPGHTITRPVLIYDTAATALWLLGLPVPESFWGRPVESAFE